MLSVDVQGEEALSAGLREKLRFAAAVLVRVNEDLAWHYDRWLLEHRFRHQFGRNLNLAAPHTFNEKVCYKRLYDRRPLLTMVADKARVRDHVAAKIGAQHLTAVYQICASPEEIAYDRLPRQFVIKASHGTAMTYIARDPAQAKVARDAAAMARFSSWLTQNLYFEQREWCYRDIPPRLIVEELLLEDGVIPADWKFYVFDGRAVYVDVHFGRYARDRRNMYDRSLRRMNVRWLYPNLDVDPVFPANMEEMFELAEALAEGFDFVRVDLYNIHGRIVFGELTNYPYGGMAPFDPPEFDDVLGAEWTMPSRY